jgi:hypothetical protein
VRPHKRGHELLLQVVNLLELEELLGEAVQLADLTIASGIHGDGRVSGSAAPAVGYSLATCSSSAA